MPIDPTRAAFDAFKALPRDEPCHMLNLVALRPAALYPAGHPLAGEQLTGVAAYARYGAQTRAVFAGVGGRILWSATPRLMLIGPSAPAEAWDIAFIAAYPTAAAFLAMVTNPDYQAAVVHRTAAVADSRLVRCAPRDGAGGFG